MRKRKYFCKWDWTGQIRLIRFNKSRCPHKSSRTPLKNGWRPFPSADFARSSILASSDGSPCGGKAKMSALSKVGMSVFFLLVERFGGCGSDGCGADEQARAESD